MLRRAIVLPLLLVCPLLAQKPADDTCPSNLECLHDAGCVKKSFSAAIEEMDGTTPYDPVTGEHYFHNATDHNGWTCDCPPGRTGIRCGRSFDSCEVAQKGNDNAKGTLGCFHGGRCELGLLDVFSNEQFFCDCRDAVEVSQEDVDGADTSTILRYVGRFCEHAVYSESLCSADEKDLNTTSYFCLNGGTCNSGPAAKHSPCTCPFNYDGKHCEYRKGEVPDCTLDCGPNGSCRLGIKDYSEAEKRSGLKSIAADQGYMYCDCEDTYMGPQCEFKAETCPGGKRVCLNGSFCVESQSLEEDIDNTGWVCDCDASAKMVAGHSCQYTATDTCDDPAAQGGADFSDLEANRGFCVNGGKCHEDDMGNRYCVCTGDQYDGPHCELELSLNLGSQKGTLETDLPTFAPTTTWFPTVTPMPSVTAFPSITPFPTASLLPAKSLNTETPKAAPVVATKKPTVHHENKPPTPAPTAKKFVTTVAKTSKPTTVAEKVRTPEQASKSITNTDSVSSEEATANDEKLSRGAQFGVVMGSLVIVALLMTIVRRHRAYRVDKTADLTFAEQQYRDEDENNVDQFASWQNHVAGSQQWSAGNIAHDDSEEGEFNDVEII